MIRIHSWPNQMKAETRGRIQYGKCFAVSRRVEVREGRRSRGVLVEAVGVRGWKVGRVVRAGGGCAGAAIDAEDSAICREETKGERRWVDNV